MEEVELRHAYSWTCDNCGVENFSTAVQCDLPAEEREKIARQMGLLEDHQTLEDIEPVSENGKVESSLVMMPREVTCATCLKQYKVKIDFADEDEVEDDDLSDLNDPDDEDDEDNADDEE